MSDERPSRDLDKFIVRLPDGMRDRLAARAKAHGRSSNTEAVFALSMWLDQADWIDARVRGEEVGPWPGIRPDPLPEELRFYVLDAAKANGRTADEEIIARLEKSFAQRSRMVHPAKDDHDLDGAERIAQIVSQALDKALADAGLVRQPKPHEMQTKSHSDTP